VASRRFPPLWSGETTRCAVLCCAVLCCANSHRTRQAYRVSNRSPERLGKLGQCSTGRRAARDIRDPVCSPIHLCSGPAFNLLGVLLPTSLGELPTEISNFAIRLNLEFVAADDFENVLCVRFQLLHVWSLFLRIHGHCGDRRIATMSKRLIKVPQLLSRTSYRQPHQPM